MFCLNTPPFHQRSRRGKCRGWRAPFGQPSHGTSGLTRIPNFSFNSVHEPFSHNEYLELDLEDVGCEYYFSKAVPGLSAENVHVDIQGQVLTVRTLTEVPGHPFKWQILVPEDVEMKNISAEVHEGLLEVRLPKQNASVLPPITSTPSSPKERAPRNRTSGLWQLENWSREYCLTHPATGCQSKDVVVDIQDGFIFVESQGGGFSGEFNLPPSVDINNIAVNVIDEVLVVTLPKLERDDLQLQYHEIFNQDEISRPSFSDKTESENASDI